MPKGTNNFELYFRAISYLVAFSGLFALFVSGGVGILIFTAFVVVACFAWSIEETRWQIGERLAVVLLVVAVPLFYLDWKYRITGTNTKEILAAGSLAQLILFLCAIKLLQRKTDRDWVFIYIVSFFEILLAAGLSISPLYLLSILVYLLFTVGAVIAFEIRRSSRITNKIRSAQEKSKSVSPLSSPNDYFRLSRLSGIAFILLGLIVIFAVPLFFVFPRVGGAGLGSNPAGRTSISGFSDSVRLGEIGRLKLSDETVMRVRIEREERARLSNIYWRGVALDTFDNQFWFKSGVKKDEQLISGNRGFFLINRPKKLTGLVLQTFYLEPLSSPVLFMLSKPISIRSKFKILVKDSEGSIKTNGANFQRTSYIVRSDTSLPQPAVLKSDAKPYSYDELRYLSLPRKLDARIGELTRKIMEDSKSTNRYDLSKAVEAHLRNKFGYTLEMKAGGEQPLADFLFNVREGHCEYFATAMAIMLRTQGIATRVVNGFQQGEYNETAGVYIVKQRDAHSWVEVYFPEEDVWVRFDPTPFDGQFNEGGPVSIAGRFRKFLDALETYWIRYFIGYDSREQRSLFQSAQNSFAGYKNTASDWLGKLQRRVNEWWQDVRGDKGFQASLIAVITGIGYLTGIILGVLILVWLYRRIVRLRIWSSLNDWLWAKNEQTVVGFYKSLQKVLAGKGFNRKDHQTPLEFAFALDMPEAVRITEKYNDVRFGEKDLSKEESREIQSWLEKLEAAEFNIEKRNGKDES